MKSRPTHTPPHDRWIPRRDRWAVALLIVVAVATRVPFFKHFNLVSFDGTFYINQARVLWSGGPMPGHFPIGYPFFVSLFLPFFSDDVAAAQVVSLLASVGSVAAFFFLARSFVSRRLAFCGALLLAVTPLFVRLALETFSESTYTCFMLLALLLYARGRDFPTGLAGGVAAITRPEMLAISGLMTLARARAPRRALMLLAGFLLVYSVNAAVLYRATGRISVLQKTEFFGTRAQAWLEREKSVEEAAGGTVSKARPGLAAIAVTYVRKLPHEAAVLARHTAFVLMLLAVFGAIRRPSFLLFAMVPFLSIPLFTVRSTARYLLPYVPIVILYALVGVDLLPRARWRRVGFAALALAAAAGAVLNWNALSAPVDEGFTQLKEAGLALRSSVHPGDKLADRKPYVAFYSGAEYTEIPMDNYDATMDYLVRENVRYLSLFFPVIDAVRPALSPLLTEAAVIQGELRYQQVYTGEGGLLIYERTGQTTPLRWTRLTAPDVGPISSPAWSPDGKMIAFVTKGERDGGIVWIPADGSAAPRTLVDGPGNDDHPAWSHDGTRLAFASTHSGNWDVYVYTLATRQAEQITARPEADGAPAWLPGDRDLLFVSGPGETRDLWKIRLATRELTQVTTMGNIGFPVVSPSGRRVAAVLPGRGVAVMDAAGGATVIAEGPREVQYPPTWSPDERFIAVTAKDWGSVDVYLLTADGKLALLLTKNAAADDLTWFDGYPAWSPDGSRIAVVSNHEGFFGLYVLEGFEPYCERLLHPVSIATFDVEPAAK